MSARRQSDVRQSRAQAHLSLALALRRVGRTAEANDHYRIAIELNPALGR